MSRRHFVALCAQIVMAAALPTVVRDNAALTRIQPMTDNTAELQALIDKGGAVTIPQGVWYINKGGLQLRSNLTLTVLGNLQALPNAENWSFVLRGQGVSNVHVVLQGNIVGDRQTHTYVTNDEHGMGISLENCNEVIVRGPGSISQCHGDAIYIIGCKGIMVTETSLTQNRRNNISVVDVDGLQVYGNTISYANGTAPMAGIDLEPDPPQPGVPDEWIKNVEIYNNIFVADKGCAILFGFGGQPKSHFQNIKIHNNTYKDCKPISGIVPWYANLGYATLRWLPWYNYQGFYTSLTL